MLSETLMPGLVAGAFGIALIILVTSTFLIVQRRTAVIAQRLGTLVTDIDPDPKVKESMNEINAAQRMRVTATEKGEAVRILRVKPAEGDAQSKVSQGRGIADQRQAIVARLRASVYQFRKSVPGTTAEDEMNLVLMTRYFDMLKKIKASSRANATLIPHYGS